MRILMIGEKDAANASLARIAQAFLQAGHEVVLYAPYVSDNVLRAFPKRIPRHSFEELDESAIERCDIIFASALSAPFFAAKGILQAHKPVFTQNYLAHGQLVFGGDLCFISSLAVTTSAYCSILRYPRIGIGEPKYDRRFRRDHDAKVLLFLDSGHYPFGMDGKRELARTLLRICQQFPRHKLIVKPRFLPGDQIVTHRNALHLYDVLYKESSGALPENLQLLDRHLDLMELISMSHAVICLYTSAFVGVCVAGKGLVILDGLPSEDVYDVREKHFQRTRKIMKNSGALVDYREAHRLLPDGVRCTQEYLDFLLAEKSCASEKIVEVCAWLYEHFYSRGRFPKIMDCDYSHYRALIQEDISMAWENCISMRYKNYLLQGMLSLIDFHVKAKINVHSIVEKVFSFAVNDMISEINFQKAVAEMHNARDDCLIENAEKLLQDEIDAGILLNAYFLRKKYQEIQSFPIRNIGAFYLFHGFVQYKLKNFAQSIVLLEQYMEISQNRPYIKEISDMSNNRWNAFFYFVVSLIQRYKTL